MEKRNRSDLQMLELRSLNKNCLSFHLKDLQISRSETKQFETLYVY